MSIQLQLHDRVGKINHLIQVFILEEKRRDDEPDIKKSGLMRCFI